MLWAVSLFAGAGSWGRLGDRYINWPHLCCNFRRRFFVSLAFSITVSIKYKIVRTFGEIKKMTF
jgi:hypothetical protein